MADSRFLIAVTPEIPVEDEGRKIESLLRAGWHRVHLRHPHATRTEMRSLIESISQDYHGRIVLHGHFDLICDFNLGGLHLNRRCPTPPALYNGPLSCSCHSVDEIEAVDNMEYVTLSPIFDSISKTGYKSNFSAESLIRLDKCTTPVVALGGIAPEHFKRLKCFHFNGYAMLGAIPWNATCLQVEEFAAYCIANADLSNN